ncbi:MULTISPECIES: N-acetyltransferase [unclassified Bacillus (in: firmicutes)]|uniref:GNAT family N-acetyltransferase n=1 Tax=unclassified Bacillus (in: firmicutes) TaxID=185979 RepID=UPI000BF17B80|nr:MULTISPECIES: GNAT family N-acetyltransferase [unclassified Bacillus (in: firmicutes)]PEJ56664.1 GNAT family N-acetyltransferase [Bacillus sp. AFS002410]PEL06512.1 GNAT family N-acetyltransferase [Bacillus sp. AFS017336]
MSHINKIQFLTKEHWSLLLLADPSKEMVDKYIQKSHIYEIVDRNLLVGIIVLMEISNEEIEIKNIAIDPAFQGNGYGKSLIHFGIRESKKLGYSKISICTGNSSTHQLALYKNCGFRISTISRDFFIQNYEEEIWENGIQCKDLIKLEQIIG